MKKVIENIEDVKVEEGVGPISTTEVETLEKTNEETTVAAIALVNLKYGDLEIKIGQEFDVEKTEIEEFIKRGLVE